MPNCVWEQLINSIPDAWLDIIKNGNQNDKDNDFLALPIANEITDVYHYKNGKLHFLDRDVNNTFNLIATPLVGRPGEVVQGNVPYPHMNQLKRVNVSHHNNKLTLIPWTLPKYKQDTIYLLKRGYC